MRYQFVILFSVVTLMCSAQDQVVTSALKFYNSYRKDGDVKKLRKAKEKIDAATVHPESVNLSKTWLYRGKIYLALYMYEVGELARESTAAGEREKRDESYLAAPDSLLQFATEAYIRSKSLDVKQAYPDDIGTGINDCYYTNANSGFANYKSGSAAVSTNCFYRCFELSRVLGKFDTIILYDAALSGLKAKQFARTIPWCDTLTGFNYQPTDSWWILTQCYVQSGDTINARKSVNYALRMFPDDQKWKWLYLDVLLAAKNFTIADEHVRVTYAGAGNWIDAATCLSVGNVYDQLANPVGSDGTPLERPWNFEVLISRAEIYYKRAIDLKPDYFDAHYNLGVLYYNQGAFIYNTEIVPGENPKETEKRWTDLISKARDEFEQARLLNPEDYNTLNGLKTCYAYLGESEKYQEVKEKVKSLEK